LILALIVTVLGFVLLILLALYLTATKQAASAPNAPSFEIRYDEVPSAAEKSATSPETPPTNSIIPGGQDDLNSAGTETK